MLNNTSVSGELKTWHKISINFAAEGNFGETTSTFRDYRLDVTFTNQSTGETIVVPGYFAADGDAGNTSATQGNIWRVNFNPPTEGEWAYEASFRTGKDIAASTNSQAGSATDFDGASGTLSIGKTDKTGEDFRAKGMILQDRGTNFLQYQGDGDYFVRGGPGVPENFLASKDIDNTQKGRHDYSTHFNDFNPGDPLWGNEKGRNIIGAVNYLAEQGQNTIYFITNTAGGDGKDVWPWADSSFGNLGTFKSSVNNAANTTNGLSANDFSVFDVSKLAQWEIIFDHMDEKGIYKNVLLQERENDKILDGGTNVSGSSLSVERLIYLREMIARFGHSNGIQWNLGEENRNTNQQHVDMSDYIKAVDPYDHLVVIHNFPNERDRVFNPLLGNESFDGTSLQISGGQIRQIIKEFKNKSNQAGDPWVLAWDEDSSSRGEFPLNGNNPDNGKEVAQRQSMWGMLTAGGSGVNWYIKNTSGQSLDQNIDNFKAFESVWKWTAAATKFYNTYIPFWEMSEADNLTPNGNDYVSAKPGEYYVAYRPYGTANNVSLDLRDEQGKMFDVFWYNPREGGNLISDGQVQGGSIQQLGGAPQQTGKDWVFFVRNSELSGELPITQPVPIPEPIPEPTPEPTPSPEPTPEPTPNPTNSLTIEAESMQLGGEYKVENLGAASGDKVISLRGGAVEGTGTAKFNFNGAAGNYNVKVHYFDENDGVGKINLKQGNQQVGSFNLNKQLGSPLANASTLTSTEIKNVSVKAGETFTLEGFEDGNAKTAEHTRIDRVEFIPVPEPTPKPQPQPTPTPSNSLVVQAESMQLGGEYKVENLGAASGGKVISLRGGAVEGTGTAKFNFNGAAGNYNVKISYFDENDGVGKINLNQGNQQVGSFNLNKQLGSPLANASTLTSTEIKNVSVKAGETFALEGFEDGNAKTAEHTRIDKIEFIPVSQSAPKPEPTPVPTPTPQPVVPNDPGVTPQKMQAAGISQRAINYIYNEINPEQKAAVLKDEAFQDTINSILASDSVPANAIEITQANQNTIAQIENGQGKTFVLRGDLNFGKTLRVPNNTTIYVDGTITKNGSHIGNFVADENKGNDVDAVFRVDDKSNVKLIGVNNAKLVSNNRATGVYIEGSSNVEVQGFDIGNVWEGVVAHWGNKNVKILNNYIHDTGKRAVWGLGSENVQAAHNFIENAGWDGFDWDAYTTGNTAYENVVIGWRRWAGFVEEGTQDSYFAKNLAVMAEFEYKHPDPNFVPDTGYTMGWADAGTSEGYNRQTSNNYFIGNTLFKPSSYTRKSGGDYFARRRTGKGQTYFWGNGGNVGYANNTSRNTPDSQENSNDIWYKANLQPTVAPGQSTLNKFEALFPVSSNFAPSPNASEAIRINTGGVAFTDSNGDFWMADKYFQGGKTYSTTAGIDKTQDDTLFQSERYAQDLSYAIPVENGNYKVNLNFAEIYFNQNNERVFDVKVENQVVLDNLDINKGVGDDTALEKSFDVNVQDGVLNLDLNASINNAKLSGIEILPA